MPDSSHRISFDTGIGGISSRVWYLALWELNYLGLIPRKLCGEMWVRDVLHALNLTMYVSCRQGEGHAEHI